MILSISSFEIIVAIPYPKIFLCIFASDADAAADNTNGIKTLLTNDFTTLFIKVRSVFNNDWRSLTRNPTYCTILDSWVF